MNRSTDATAVVVVPVEIATADVGVVQVGRVAPVGRAVAEVRVARVGRVVAEVRVARVVPVEAAVRRVPMVQSSPGTVRPGTKDVKHRVAALAGHCRVPRTTVCTPTMPIPREALVRRAILASTSVVLAPRRETVHRVAHGPKVLLAARHKAMADAIIAAPTVVRVPPTPPAVPVVVAVQPTAVVDLDLVQDRAGPKATDRNRRAAIAIGVVAGGVAGTSPLFPRRRRIRQPPRPSLRPQRYRSPQYLPKTPARPRRILNPSR